MRTFRSIQMGRRFLQRKTGPFLQDNRGTGAIEFAALVPFMLLLFFGSLEIAELKGVDRRMTTSANTLADLVSQSNVPSGINQVALRISRADADILIDNVAATLQVPNLDDVTVNLVSVVQDPDGDDNVIVHWSRGKNGTTPYAQGDDYVNLDDDSVVPPGVGIIIAEIQYTYSRTITDRIFDRPFLFEQQADRWPRGPGGHHIQLCNDAINGTGCTETPQAST